MQIQISICDAIIRDLDNEALMSSYVEGINIKQCSFSITDSGHTVNHTVLAGYKYKITEQDIRASIDFVTSDLMPNKGWKHTSLFFCQMVVLASESEILFNKQDGGIIRSGFEYYLVKNSMQNDNVDGMKPDAKFTGKTLRGLWHRHIVPSSPWAIAHNLLNQHSGQNWLQNTIQGVLNDGSEFVTRAHIAEITKKAVHGAMQDRHIRNNITGEWLIYHVTDDGCKLILSLAAHEENDKDIKERIAQGHFSFG